LCLGVTFLSNIVILYSARLRPGEVIIITHRECYEAKAICRILTSLLSGEEKVALLYGL
jgi:hypothetical protein